MIDERRPVLIGGGQITNRVDDLDDVIEPVALMTEALRRAEVDTGVGPVLVALERIVAVAGAWSYSDPAAIVARSVGASNAATALTNVGGDTPQATVAILGQAIMAGELDLAALVGGEAVYGRRKLRAVGREMVVTHTDDPPAERTGSELTMGDTIADSRGFDTPANVYALFEDAIRADRGETHDQHRARLGRLWEAFNRVAVDNPHSWVRTPMTAEQIVTPSAANRMVGWPYTKAMNSNWFVDQAAAVIVCSVAAARRLGIAPDRWVFLHSAASGRATARVAQRDNYWSSPAVAETARAALRLAGVGIDDIAMFDLYSCFPSMVQLTMAELGLTDADARPVTLTGGLTFFGGPFNNYVTHALVETIARVRAGDGLALVHANGGYATKQAFGLYGADPPAAGFRAHDCQPVIDRYPTRVFDTEFAGEASVEAGTVLHSRDGPERALITALTPTGARAMGSTTDPDTMTLLMTEPCERRSVTFPPDQIARLVHLSGA